MSWVQVMHGQGLRPRGYHGLVDLVPDAEVSAFAERVRGVIQNCAEQMPTHDAFIARLLEDSAGAGPARVAVHGSAA